MGSFLQKPYPASLLHTAHSTSPGVAPQSGVWNWGLELAAVREGFLEEEGAAGTGIKDMKHTSLSPEPSVLCSPLFGFLLLRG